MAQNHPTVQQDTLIYQLDWCTQEILLETSEWYAWLELASTFTFRSASGTFTARKERAGNKRGGRYWKAYHKREGKLLSAYLGKSETLTNQRLHAIAAKLNEKENLTSSRVRHASPPGSSFLPALPTAVPVGGLQVEQASRRGPSISSISPPTSARSLCANRIRPVSVPNSEVRKYAY
jgi:hypothetical protein